MAAALGVPCALRLLLHVAAEPEPRRAGLAVWGGTGAGAGALGYLVGGVLTEAFDWRAIYIVNAPIGLALLVAVFLLVPDVAATDRHRGLDLPGAGLLVVVVIALTVGASLLERPDARTVAECILAAGGLLVAVFALQQRRASTPLIPHAAVRSRNLRTGLLMSFVNTATTSSAGVLATLLLQQHLALSPVDAALTLMPFSLAVIAGSALSRPLAARVPDAWSGSIGLGGVAAGNLTLALTAGSIAGLVSGIMIAGAGLGIAAVGATSLGTRVSIDLTGSAAGLLNTAAQLGTALGVAALLAVGRLATPPAGTAIAWATAAGLAGLTSLLLLIRPPGGRGRPPSEFPAGSERSRAARPPDDD
jgi:MFS family permease